jgi:hypothetical protein
MRRDLKFFHELVPIVLHAEADLIAGHTNLNTAERCQVAVVGPIECGQEFRFRSVHDGITVRDNNNVVGMDEKKDERHVVRNVLFLDGSAVPVCPFSIHALVRKKLLITELNEFAMKACSS